MNEIKQVDTRLRYASTPDLREIVASVVLQELRLLLQHEDEDWMKRKITNYIHQCLTNINKRIPMKLFHPGEIYRHCKVENKVHYMSAYKGFPFLAWARESYDEVVPVSLSIDTNAREAWLWEDGSAMLRELKDLEYSVNVPV